MIRAVPTPRPWHGLALWLACAAAAAQAQPVEDTHASSLSLADSLVVEPGATCVQGDSLAPQIAAWLGEQTMPEGMQVRVRGAPDDPRDVAFEVWRDGRVVAQRRFAPAPFVCAQLEASLALAIAMALEASLRGELLGELAPPPRPRRHGTLWLQGRAGTGLLPRRSFGGGLGYAHRFGKHLGLRADTLFDGARGATLPDASGHFDTWLLSGQLAACGLLPLGGQVETRACGGVAAGALKAVGRGYASASATWLAWVAAAGHLGLSVRLPRRVWLDLPVTLHIPLNDVSFQVVDAEGERESSRALPVVGLTVGLAVGYRL